MVYNGGLEPRVFCSIALGSAEPALLLIRCPGPAKARVRVRRRVLPNNNQGQAVRIMFSWSQSVMNITQQLSVPRV